MSIYNRLYYFLNISNPCSFRALPSNLVYQILSIINHQCTIHLWIGQNRTQIIIQGIKLFSCHVISKIFLLHLYHIGLHKYFFQFRDNTIRYKSERLRDEAEKLIKSRENKTVLTQHESNQKLNNRLHDVVLFRSELEVCRKYSLFYCAPVKKY